MKKPNSRIRRTLLGGVFRWFEAEAALSANFDASAVDGVSIDASDLMSDLHELAAYQGPAG
jgi:carbon-monoxide dehydrogenase medium subunit